MNKHFFFDGYELKEKALANINNMEKLTNIINKQFFNNNGKITIIPYFNGKIKEDGGVSGIIIGPNSHFTCHTFCYKSAMFVDYYGNKENHEKIKNEVLKIYSTNDYDLCINNKNIKGNFGKHIITELDNKLTYDEGIKLIKQILKDIDMTPINDIINFKIDDINFDLIQPIAESHISIHQTEESTTIDVFSCKYFDEQKLLKLLNTNDYREINRGIKYK